MRDLRFLFKTHYCVSRALVIGIDKYKSASPLSYAVSDAISIRDLLVSDFGFPESEVTLLTDTVATKQAILKAFLRFANDDVGGTVTREPEAEAKSDTLYLMTQTWAISRHSSVGMN
jgi:hypothetical protein